MFKKICASVLMTCVLGAGALQLGMANAVGTCEDDCYADRLYCELHEPLPLSKCDRLFNYCMMMC